MFRAISVTVFATTSVFLMVLFSHVLLMVFFILMFFSWFCFYKSFHCTGQSSTKVETMFEMARVYDVILHQGQMIRLQTLQFHLQNIIMNEKTGKKNPHSHMI